MSEGKMVKLTGDPVIFLGASQFYLRGDGGSVKLEDIEEIDIDESGRVRSVKYKRDVKMPPCAERVEAKEPVTMSVDWAKIKPGTLVLWTPPLDVSLHPIKCELVGMGCHDDLILCYEHDNYRAPQSQVSLITADFFKKKIDGESSPKKPEPPAEKLLQSPLDIAKEFIARKTIQIRPKGGNHTDWVSVDSKHGIDMDTYEYRAKPEKDEAPVHFIRSATVCVPKGSGIAPQDMMIAVEAAEALQEFFDSYGVTNWQINGIVSMERVGDLAKSDIGNGKYDEDVADRADDIAFDESLQITDDDENWVDVKPGTMFRLKPAESPKKKAEDYYRPFTAVEAAEHIQRLLHRKYDFAHSFAWHIKKDNEWGWQVGLDGDIFSPQGALEKLFFTDTGEPFGVKVKP